MKLAFSTLGCPAWDFAAVLDTARRLGYDGIEFRGLHGEMELPNVPEFAPARIADTRRALEDAGLQATCLSSSVQVVASTASEVDRITAIAHTERYIDLAKEVGAPFVRVFCGNVPADVQRGVAMDKAADSLRRIGEFAQARGVTAVVETHDAFVRSELLMELIQLANHPGVQVLWDIHHPYRLEAETVAHTMRYLDGHVRYTHVKDSVMNTEGDGFTYVPLGQGDVPAFQAMRALKAAGYAGFLTLEWEKRWHPELADPEIIFPQYIEQMRAWLAEL